MVLAVVCRSWCGCLGPAGRGSLPAGFGHTGMSAFRLPDVSLEWSWTNSSSWCPCSDWLWSPRWRDFSLPLGRSSSRCAVACWLRASVCWSSREVRPHWSPWSSTLPLRDWHWWLRAHRARRRVWVGRELGYLYYPALCIHKQQDDLAEILDKLSSEHFRTAFLDQRPIVFYCLCHLRNGDVGSWEPLTVKIL